MKKELKIERQKLWRRSFCFQMLSPNGAVCIIVVCPLATNWVYLFTELKQLHTNPLPDCTSSWLVTSHITKPWPNPSKQQILCWRGIPRKSKHCESCYHTICFLKITDGKNTCAVAGSERHTACLTQLLSSKNSLTNLKKTGAVPLTWRKAETVVAMVSKTWSNYRYNHPWVINFCCETTNIAFYCMNILFVWQSQIPPVIQRVAWTVDGLYTSLCLKPCSSRTCKLTFNWWSNYQHLCTCWVTQLLGGVADARNAKSNICTSVLIWCMVSSLDVWKIHWIFRCPRPEGLEISGLSLQA